VKRISPKEAKALMDQGWTYLDVRTEEEFRAGHPAKAMNVPFFVPGPPGQGGLVANPGFLSTVEGRFAKDAQLVVGCMAGGRSLKAATALEQAGFKQIVDQRAGFGGNQTEPGWASEGLPVER
jgi:rhodanese-related sulfurtransferase